MKPIPTHKNESETDDHSPTATGREQPAKGPRPDQILRAYQNRSRAGPHTPLSSPPDLPGVYITLRVTRRFVKRSDRPPCMPRHTSTPNRRKWLTSQALLVAYSHSASRRPGRMAMAERHRPTLKRLGDRTCIRNRIQRCDTRSWFRTRLRDLSMPLPNVDRCSASRCRR